MTTWSVRLANQAEQDVEDILLWTEAHFGTQQAEVYLEVMTTALEALIDGPDILGCTKRDDILLGIRVLHVARYGRKGRHYLIFKVDEDDFSVEVLRILHDSMDLPRHLDATDQQAGH